MNAPDKIKRGIDNQAVFGKTNCEREIGNDRIFRIVLARIGVEPGWNIDAEDEGVFFAPQAIDVTGRGPERFPQK